MVNASNATAAKRTRRAAADLLPTMAEVVRDYLSSVLEATDGDREVAAQVSGVTVEAIDALICEHRLVAVDVFVEARRSDLRLA